MGIVRVAKTTTFPFSNNNSYRLEIWDEHIILMRTKIQQVLKIPLRKFPSSISKFEHNEILENHFRYFKAQ